MHGFARQRLPQRTCTVLFKTSPGGWGVFLLQLLTYLVAQQLNSGPYLLSQDSVQASAKCSSHHCTGPRNGISGTRIHQTSIDAS